MTFLRIIPLVVFVLSQGTLSIVENSSNIAMCELSAMIQDEEESNSWKCLNGIPSFPICSNGNISSWAGVGCENGFISSVRISNKRLHGVLPDSIGEITSLKYLSLFHLSLEGTIPASIGNLKSLLHLSLQGNNLQGTIPKEIGNLSNLKELWLSSNQLSGEIPQSFKKLSSIMFIGLANNLLVGQVPACLGELKQLKSIHMHNNNFSGVIPPALCDATALGTFYLYWPGKQTNAQINSELVCYPSCLTKLREKKFGNLPVCSAQQMLVDTPPSTSLFNELIEYLGVLHPGYHALASVLGLRGMSFSEVIEEGLYSMLQTYRDMKYTAYDFLSDFEVFASNAPLKKAKKFGVKSRRTVSGIFFYRKSAGATISVAVGLAVVAGSISFAIASVVYPSRSARELDFSLIPGAHLHTAPAA